MVSYKKKIFNTLSFFKFEVWFSTYREQVSHSTAFIPFPICKRSVGQHILTSLQQTIYSVMELKETYQEYSTKISTEKHCICQEFLK